MRRVRFAVLAAALLALVAATAMAQPVVPAKSGLVTYIEGTAYLDGKELTDAACVQCPSMPKNGVLRTTEGRAEIIMNPGLTMRVGENTELKMVDNSLVDTQVELVKGSAVVQFSTEFVDVQKDNAFTLLLNGASIAVVKAGDYRFDAQPPRLKVFAGLAKVAVDGQIISVSSGKMLNLGGGTAAVEKFDIDQTDALDRWSGRRGELQAQANASSARQANEDPNCYSYNPSGRYSNSAVSSRGNPCVGKWRWNPWYGLWTYIPFGRAYCDPIWGYCYYNPRDVIGAYYRPPVTVWNTPPSYGGGPSMGGYSVPAGTSSGSSGAVASSGAAVSAPSAGSGASSGAAAAASSAGHGSSGGSGK